MWARTTTRCLVATAVLGAACGDGGSGRGTKDATAPDTGVTTDADSVIATGPGALDPTFGDQGIAIVATPGNDERGRAVAIQADDKIIVAGKGNDDFIVVRMTDRGAVDTQFGDGGVVMSDFKDSYDEGKSLVALAGGGIALGGITTRGGDADFGLLRFAGTGVLEPSFSGDGKAGASFGPGSDEGKGLIRQNDGAFVMVGQSHDGSDNDFALARFSEGGAPDTSFGEDGQVTLDFAGRDDEGNAVRQDADETLIVVGYSTSATDQDFAVARLSPGGNADETFGTGGRVTTPIGAGNDVAFAMALQADRRIVAVGVSYVGDEPGCAAVRYTTSGALDPEFGNGGVATYRLAGGDIACTGAAIDSAGRILLGGTARRGDDADFAVVRLTAQGTVDPTFGVGGIAYASIGPADGAYAMAIQSDDKIVLVGETKRGGDIDIAVVRLLSE